MGKIFIKRESRTYVYQNDRRDSLSSRRVFFFFIAQRPEAPPCSLHAAGTPRAAARLDSISIVVRLQRRSNNYGNRWFALFPWCSFSRESKILREGIKHRGGENIGRIKRKEGNDAGRLREGAHGERARFSPSSSCPISVRSASLSVESTITGGRIITAITDRGVTDCWNKHKPAPLSDGALAARFSRLYVRGVLDWMLIRYSSNRTVATGAACARWVYQWTSSLCSSASITIISNRFHSRPQVYIHSTYVDLGAILGPESFVGES